MTAPRTKTWTAIEIATLEKMCEDGDSPAAIARVLDRTKNSVIGRIHRHRINAMSKPERPAAPSVARAVPITVAPVKIGAIPIVPVLQKKTVAAPTVPCAIGDVSGCRYEISGGSDPAKYIFCNTEQQEQSSYCPDHHHICCGRAVTSYPSLAKTNLMFVAKMVGALS